MMPARNETVAKTLCGSTVTAMNDCELTAKRNCHEDHCPRCSRTVERSSTWTPPVPRFVTRDRFTVRAEDMIY